MVLCLQGFCNGTRLTCFQKSMPNTWSNTNVDINLDALSPTGRQNKMANPSMNQLQQVTPSPTPAAGKLKVAVYPVTISLVNQVTAQTSWLKNNENDIVHTHTHTQSHEHSQAGTCMHIQACMRTHHNTHSLSLHLSQSFPSPPICSIMFLLVCTRKSDWSVGFLLVMLAAKVQDCWHCHSKSILFKGTVLLMLIIVIIPCQLCNYQKTRVK